MPPPSAEIVLVRVAISAFLRVIGPRRADEFLREMAQMLADEESLASIVQIRPSGSAAEVSKARRGAIALFRALLPTFLANVRR